MYIYYSHADKLRPKTTSAETKIHFVGVCTAFFPKKKLQYMRPTQVQLPPNGSSGSVLRSCLGVAVLHCTSAFIVLLHGLLASRL